MKNIFISVLFLCFISSATLKAQNVGISNSAVAPNASAMLDIVATDKGLLVPRFGLSDITVAAPVVAPAISLIVYNTATAGVAPNNVLPGFYYWDGAKWVAFSGSGGREWALLGNAGTVAGTNFLGTTDAQHLDFRTNNTARMRIMNSTYPTVGIGTTFPVANLSGNSAVLHIHDGGNSIGSQLILSTHSTADAQRTGVINFAATQAVNDRRAASIESYLTAISSTNVSGDLRFFTNNVNSFTEKMRIFSTGRVTINSFVTPIAMLDVRHTAATTLTDLATIFSNNSNNSGTAINATGQGALVNGLVTGSGAAFIGVSTGVFSQYTSAGVGQGMIIQDAFGSQWNVGHWTGGAYRKILGAGTVSTIVDDLSGGKVIMNCPESPENLFIDYGHGKLINGVARINIDPILSKNIIVDDRHPLKVFIQLEGDCKGVFVANKTSTSFEVHELQGGLSNVDFTYSIVATHGDQTIVSQNGEVRVAKYDERWEKAPEIQKTINIVNPVNSEK